MVWRPSKEELKKLEEGISDMAENLLKDEKFLKHFNISEEEAKAQLEKIKKS